jgi:hypothetical protein
MPEVWRGGGKIPKKGEDSRKAKKIKRNRKKT